MAAVPSLWQPMLQGGGVLVAWDPVTSAAVISFQVYSIPAIAASPQPSAIIGSTLDAGLAKPGDPGRSAHVQGFGLPQLSFRFTIVAFSPASAQVQQVTQKLHQHILALLGPMIAGTGIHVVTCRRSLMATSMAPTREQT